MNRSRHPREVHGTGSSGEEGFLLLAAVVMVAVVLITLAVAAPVIARDIRRDKEVESMHRAEQYVRAIRLYQRACKCQAYPPTMDALEKNNTMRFLRQRYIDPLTGKSDWRLIHTPQTKIHVFFGKELGELASSGSLGSAQGMQSTNGPVAMAGGGTQSSNCISSSGLAAGFNNACQTSMSGASGSTGGSGSTGSSSSSDTGMFGDSAGGPIEGVGTARTGEAILNPNGQTTYESEEFWWDPRMELLYAKANILGGGGIGTAGSSSATGLGNSISGASGSTGSGGSTGSTGSSNSGFGSSSFGKP
jgi:type II secretory pathway pseudopilin PulG